MLSCYLKAVLYGVILMITKTTLLVFRKYHVFDINLRTILLPQIPSFSSLNSFSKVVESQIFTLSVLLQDFQLIRYKV